ncbi:putative pre-rRNA-processing protein IPI1/Testis-expressed sequence 10 protein [Lupinus albus]|uniref:Putative pre-rRNA-processing protein IPI1/Testis-expressed sequence 10 protein n=1 Tax=Lupinus albus TaxID=3870 RepID=A0A6A4NFC3_LUPAL|nr:putative pre-rRNA-processing protein IPI1/Testis-expressed sequence 10 protein [Lupinus albus]
MPRAKPNAKKQKQRGVDFKKIRRKIGRKLPPPNNTTNTEIKSKAIILPEQSIAAEKVGLAVNKKGLTLKELLQKTFHHNAKVRRDALMGIKDLFIKYPEELKLHKNAAVDKLRQRIGDDDKVVRKSLYDIFKSAILRVGEEDNQELIVSLLMPYIFNAMTHLSVDIRIMAFDFLDLVLEFYPPSFSSYAEKIFQNYEDILRKNQYYLQDKGKLKDALAGLVRCLSLLPWNKGEIDLHNKDEAGKRVLHAFEADMSVSSNGFSHIVKKLKDLVPVLTNSLQEFIPLIHDMASLEVKSFGCLISILHSIDLIVRSFIYWIDKESESPSLLGGPDVNVWDVTIFSVLLKKLFPLFPLNPVHHLSSKDCDRLADLNMVVAKLFFDVNELRCLTPDLLEKLLDFLENALLGKACRVSQSGKAVWEKHLVQLLPFIPKFISRGESFWISRLLQAFTKTYRESKPGSLLKLACLSAIEDMLSPIQSMLSLDTTTPESFDLQDALIAWISELPQLLIQLGVENPACSQAVLRLQLRIGQRALLNASLVCVYDSMQHSLQEFYSTCQEGGHICYGPFLRLPKESQEFSLCCLYYFSQLDMPFLKSIASCCLSPDLDPHVLFRIIEILHSAYREGHIKIADHLSVFISLVLRFKISPVGSAGLKSCPLSQTFKTMTSVLCSYMAQMGDNYLVLKIIEKVIIDQIMLKPPLDNSCSLLRMLVTVDSKPTSLSDQSIAILGHCLSEYLMDAVQCIPDDDDEQHSPSIQSNALYYYLLPCFFLLDRCHKLMNLVLKTMGSAITDSSLFPMSDNCTQQTRNCLIRVNTIASVIVLMHKDAKLKQIMSIFKEDIDNIAQKVLTLQLSERVRMTIEEKHKLQLAYDKLKIISR